MERKQLIDISRGVLLCAGCMAERLKKKILETDKMVDLVAGPGMYMYCLFILHMKMYWYCRFLSQFASDVSSH